MNNKRFWMLKHFLRNQSHYTVLKEWEPVKDRSAVYFRCKSVLEAPNPRIERSEEEHEIP